MSELFNKFKEKILYLFFGCCTTFINIATFYSFYEMFGISNVLSNILAWVFAVFFAFITNKIWVFESNSTNVKTMVYQLGTFIGFRLATGLLDLAIMIVGVDLLKWNGLVMKIISNVLVIILNYILSKLVVFKNDVDSSSS